MKKGRSLFVSVLVICLLLVTVSSLFAQETMNWYLASIAIMTALTGGLVILDNKSIRSLMVFHKGFVLWFIVFFAFIAIHYSFMHWDSFSFLRRMRIWLPPLIAFVWLSRFNDSELLEKFGKCCAIAFIPFVFLVLSINGLYFIADDIRFGGDEFTLNANIIALHTLFFNFFVLILYNSNKRWRVFLFCLMVGMAVLIFITGCRRAIIGLVFLYIGYFWVFGQKHRLRNIVLGVGVISLIAYVLLNVDIIYNVAGLRMEKLFYNWGFIDSSKSIDMYDYSSEVRSEMIPLALAMFTLSPIWGNGYAYFITHSGLNISTQSYSAHNNYLEILVNYGAVGFVIYYSVIIYILVLLYKYRKRNITIHFLFVLLLIHLIVIEPTTVNFCNYVIYYIFYFICFRMVQSEKNKIIN